MATDEPPVPGMSADTTPAATDGADSTRPRRTVGTGLAAGLFATVVMTLFRMPISRSPPPTARFWARYLDDGDPSASVGPGLLLHLGYGAGAGGVFGALLGPRLSGTEAERERTATLAGALYGLFLSGFGILVLLDRVLGMNLDPDERFVFHVSHLVYGLALGTAFGAADRARSRSRG